MRGTPVSPMRTRPNSLGLGQAHSSNSDPAYAPFINQSPPQTNGNDQSVDDAANVATNPLLELAHDLGYDDTFPGSVEERSNPTPDERVAPPNPIVTPRTEDEMLVPGTELPRSMSVEQEVASKSQAETGGPTVPTLL
jgi:hypothetical protein